ncbi:MAG: hypothetical protein U0X73_07370 [Thermoanaerobaculia bacterium]
MESPTGSDPLLASYIHAPDDAAAGERLGELLVERASPLIATILRRQLGGRVPAEDLEDLESGALLRLQQQLLALRGGAVPAIASFDDYVAVVAYNAATAVLRERRPQRHRLRQRIRYVVAREAALASWSGPARELLCALERHRDRRPVEEASLLARAASAALAREGRAPAAFGRLVRATLENLGAPCRLESLTDALAPLLGVRDAELVSLTVDEGDAPGVEPAAGDRSALAGIEDRELMDRLWSEIAELPVRQRQALLLNLRDAAGGDLLAVTLAAGLVPRARLGELLAASSEEIEGLLPSLPREDLWIAERLGVSRQQVINLRKSARLRLARRLRGWLASGGTTDRNSYSS